MLRNTSSKTLRTGDRLTFNSTRVFEYMSVSPYLSDAICFILCARLFVLLIVSLFTLFIYSLLYSFILIHYLFIC